MRRKDQSIPKSRTGPPCLQWVPVPVQACLPLHGIFFFPTMSVAPLVVADRKYSENKNIMDLNWAADRGCEEPAKVKAAHLCLTL